jgi:exopolyphosphatase / guanosine-5'-triphosphate,3'-diphosphate pyrophosphatase
MSFIFSRKTTVVILLSIAALLFTGWYCTPKTITRAAVDVGSGSIKVTVAEVDPENSKIHRILYSQEHPVPLKRDIQVGGKSILSEKIQMVAFETLSNLQNELAIHRPTEWKGIATAASRQAKNAQDMYEKINDALGIDISIISQNEEGRLGFGTAAAVSKIPQEKLIAVDSGSGSFQITTLIDDHLEVVEGQLGYIPSLEMLMDIRGQKLDLQTLPAPVTLKEAELLVERMCDKMPELPEAFLQKSQDSTNSIVGIGNENFIFAMGATGVGKTTFTKEELWQAISRYAGKPVEELKQFAKPDTAVLGMVLLYSIMDSMGLDQITSCYANGSCEGLLVDREYWSQPSSEIELNASV